MDTSLVQSAPDLIERMPWWMGYAIAGIIGAIAVTVVGSPLKWAGTRWVSWMSKRENTRFRRRLSELASQPDHQAISERRLHRLILAGGVCAVGALGIISLVDHGLILKALGIREPLPLFYPQMFVAVSLAFAGVSFFGAAFREYAVLFALREARRQVIAEREGRSDGVASA